MLDMTRLPANVAADVGAKRTVTMVDPPAGMAKGAADEGSRNPAGTVSELIESGAVPVLFTVRGMSRVMPTKSVP